MKTKKKERHHNENIKCDVCGLEQEYMDILNRFDIVNLDIPIMVETPSILNPNAMCSECKKAILDEIWDNVLKHKAKKNVFKMFFDLKKHIRLFITKNRHDFTEIAEEYRHIAIVANTFNRMLDDNARQTSMLSKRHPSVPSLEKIYTLLADINSHRIYLDEERKWDDELQLVEDTEVTKDNVRELFPDDEVVDVLSDYRGVHIIQVDLKPYLVYDSDVTIHFRFLTLNLMEFHPEATSDNDGETTTTDVIKTTLDLGPDTGDFNIK